MAGVVLLGAACPVGTVVGTLTWGRLQVLEASFMAFRMLPEKAEGECEASWVPRPGERPPERHSTCSSSWTAPTPPLGLIQHGTQWTTGLKQRLVNWSAPPGGVQLELV